MASLDQFVDVQISASAQQVTQKGFGRILLLSAHQKFTDRVRIYEDLEGLIADGFAETDPEYLAAQFIFSQSPRPPDFALGRRANLPTMKATITPAAQNNTRYVVAVNGHRFEYESDANATAGEIVAGLIALINGQAGLGVTATGVNTLILTASAAGAWFSLETSSPALLPIEVDNVDPGVTADLNAIALENGDWYAIASIFKSRAEVLAIAAWAEANKRLFVVSSADGPILANVNTDVASQLQAASYRFTAAIFHPNNGAFADAAWLGRCLPLDPGSETWALKTLAGVEDVPLTPTQRTNAQNKNCNTYELVAGIRITNKGVTAIGEYIDQVRGLDWLSARIQESVFGLLANADGKIPYTDAGAAMVQSTVLARLKEGVGVGLLRDDPAPVVTVPRVRNVQADDRKARRLPNVTFSAELAGAIQAAKVRGVVTV